MVDKRNSDQKRADKKKGNKRKPAQDDDDMMLTDMKAMDEAPKATHAKKKKKDDTKMKTLKQKLRDSKSFQVLEDFVSPATMQAISSFKFSDMTEIQSQAIPKLLKMKDLRGTAKTGSGKTLAFLIPAFELLSKNNFIPEDGTGVLVISPTRELCMQTFSVAEVFAKQHKLSYGLVTGGANRGGEAAALKQGINILFGTPGRILDHLKNTKFTFSNLRCLVLDEADRMLGMGFEEDMKRIIALLPQDRQTMLFSATRDDKTDNLAKLALKETLIEVDVDSSSDCATVDTLEQYYTVCPTQRKFCFLYKFLQTFKNSKIMVFFNCCDVVRYYSDLLMMLSIPVLSLHGKKEQSRRTQTFEKFLSASSGALLCTDVGSRGLDIPQVDWILQYDPPEDPHYYIHRVGRTARGGAMGAALILLTEGEVGPFVGHMAGQKVPLVAMRGCGDLPDMSEQLENLVESEQYLKFMAKQAFASYLATYDKHKMKHIFDKGSLDTSQVAKCFGLSEAPKLKKHINLEGSRNHQYKQKHDKKYRS